MAQESRQIPDRCRFDVAVVGAGPSGLVAALCGAEMGLSTVLVGPFASRKDTRTAALMAPAVNLLQRLGAWEALATGVAPLKAIRLVDSKQALLRAPEITFLAQEIDLDAFGYNIANALLTEVLERQTAGRLTRIASAGVSGIEHIADGIRLTTSEGEMIEASLVAAADGRHSKMRDAVAIALSSWSYDQAALVTTFRHSRDHSFVSTEFHCQTGPLTVVPMPGRRSSLVWVETPDNAARLAKLGDTAFLGELADHIQGLLGVLGPSSPRQVFRLQGQTAKTFARNRVALIGEAGHVMPPIGAQGLNLSFRDGAALAEIAATARAQGEDIGSTAVMERYDTARRPDVTSRVWGVDLLNRSLLSPYLPVNLLRGAGLFALSVSGPLRRYLMREGIGLTEALPLIMRSVDAGLDKAISPLDGLGSGRA